MSTTQSSDIVAFLSEAKHLISIGSFDFVPRRKNMRDLANLGITVQDAKNDIFSLQVRHYYSGPEADHDSSRQGNIWVFKKRDYNEIIYIKLKIVRENNRNVLKCLSFHIDE